VGEPHWSQRRVSYGPRWHGIFGGREESYLRFGGCKDTMPRARGVDAASPVWDVGSGLPRQSPGSQFWSRGSVSRSSCSSYAPIVVRSYESCMRGEITMLGSYVLRLKIGTNPGSHRKFRDLSILSVIQLQIMKTTEKS
jgi:hypothetical protein